MFTKEQKIGTNQICVFHKQARPIRLKFQGKLIYHPKRTLLESHLNLSKAHILINCVSKLNMGYKLKQAVSVNDGFLTLAREIDRRGKYGERE